MEDQKRLARQAANFYNKKEVTPNVKPETNGAFADVDVRAFVALARNANAETIKDTGLKIVAPNSKGLTKDGCDFIEATNLFLEIVGCPPDARDFVLAVMGISGGNYTEYLFIPDEKIAERLGRESQAAARKRKTFMSWQINFGHSILGFKEGDYDRAEKKYVPNSYKVIVAEYITRFIMLARSQNKWQPHQAVKRGVEEGVKQIAADVEEEYLQELQGVAKDVVKEMPKPEIITRTINMFSKKRTGQARPQKLGFQPQPYPTNNSSNNNSYNNNSYQKNVTPANNALSLANRLETEIFDKLEHWFKLKCPNAPLIEWSNFQEEITKVLIRFEKAHQA